MHLSIHFRWLDQIYLTGMVKILYWWLISTADIGTLRSFTKQILEQLFEKAKGDNKDPHPTMLEARNTSAGNYRSPVELEVGRKLRSVLPVNPNNLKIKQLMVMSSKKGQGKIRRNKASIMINTQRK